MEVITALAVAACLPTAHSPDVHCVQVCSSKSPPHTLAWKLYHSTFLGLSVHTRAMQIFRQRGVIWHRGVELR